VSESQRRRGLALAPESNLPQRISSWIRERVREAGADGVVVGLSGGVDSSVVAALARMALGERLLGLIMPCQSKTSDIEDARLVARRLGIKMKEIPLDPIYESFLEILPPGDRLTRANLKARLRMVTLYYYANGLNYLVAGTGNKSELSIGYFTKYGDGGVDILPLGGLLKTEVKQLARELWIPERIIEKIPSAGLWEDQTDEEEMGMSYEELDRAILAIESGDASGLTSEILDKVAEMMKASRHKRQPPPAFERQGKMH